MFRQGLILALFVVATATTAAAQASAPIVTMSVTLPDGRTQELTAAESRLATVSLPDGTEYGFRPTIQDSMPWNQIVVTIFKTATASAPAQMVGQLELKRGGSAVDSKTTPAFKVAVTKVSAATASSSTS